MSANDPKRTWSGREFDGSLTSFHLFDVRQLPSLVVKRLLRAVETEDHEESLVRDCREPVLALPGRLRAEVDVRRAVGLLFGLVHRVGRWERLAVFEPAGVGTAHQASGSGRGMNSVSPGTVSNLAILQSALACS